MRYIAGFVIFLALTSPTLAAAPSLEDAFSPNQGATDLVIKTIGEAKHSIEVAAYSFTSKPIAAALVGAQNKGISVKVVLDKSQRKGRGSLYQYLMKNSVPTRINSRYHIMHDKFMIIDDKVLETGSFNYTRSAEKDNAENVLVVHRDRKVIKDYSQQWEELWNEADEAESMDISSGRSQRD